MSYQPCHLLWGWDWLFLVLRLWAIFLFVNCLHLLLRASWLTFFFSLLILQEINFFFICSFMTFLSSFFQSLPVFSQDWLDFSYWCPLYSSMKLKIFTSSLFEDFDWLLLPFSFEVVNFFFNSIDSSSQLLSIFTSSARPWLVFFSLYLHLTTWGLSDKVCINLHLFHEDFLIDHCFLLFSWLIFIHCLSLDLHLHPRAFLIQWQLAGSSSSILHLAAVRLTSPNWFFCMHSCSKVLLTIILPSVPCCGARVDGADHD